MSSQTPLLNDRVFHATPSSRWKIITILGAAVITLFLLYDRFLNLVINESQFSPIIPRINHSFIATAMGQVTYDQINTEVFIPLGYEIAAPSTPIPKLRFRHEPTCEQINMDWLKIAEVPSKSETPPEDIPFALMQTYTMNNYSLFSKTYSDDKAVPSPKEWAQIPQWMTEDPHNFTTYGLSGMAVYHALNFMGVAGFSGAVIGSQNPWIETIALKVGAKEVLTVEYQTTTITGTDKVKYIHPFSFARMWKDFQGKFDFVVSFSSIEHSGLQRYGDPMDPIGDLREVLKVRCTLKENGLFFLGLPRGQDHLVYNVHRIYGRIRLAMMFAGFELVHVFREDEPLPGKLGIEHFDGQTSPVALHQDLFVLRKIASV